MSVNYGLAKAVISSWHGHCTLISDWDCRVQSETGRRRDSVFRARRRIFLGLGPVKKKAGTAEGAVAGLVGIECGVVSGVINLESSGVEASDWRPRHDEHYHEA